MIKGLFAAIANKKVKSNGDEKSNLFHVANVGIECRGWL